MALQKLMDVIKEPYGTHMKAWNSYHTAKTMERFSLLQHVIPNRILKKCPSERGTNSHSAEGQEYWVPKMSIFAKGEIILQKLSDATKNPIGPHKKSTELIIYV